MDANWWNNALASYDVGRQHRADRENAQAFRTGGYGAVEQAAGNRGDLQTAMTTRRFQDDRMQSAYQRMEQIRPLALGALDRVGQLPAEQRLQFLNQPHIRQRFIDWGITPEQYDAASQQIANPETGAEALASYRAAFTQHQDPNWQLAVVPTEDGQGVEQRGVALGPNGEILRGEGSMPVPPGEVQSFGSGGLYRQNQNNPQGYEVLREPRSVAGGGGGGGQAVSPGGNALGGGNFDMRALTAQERRGVEDASSASRRAIYMAQRLQRFEALNRTQPSGDLQRFNVLNGNAQEMRSITEELISFLRQPGEGTMSDADVARFRATLPSLERYGPSNSATIRAFEEVARNAAGYAEFIQEFVRSNGTTLGAAEMWNSYLYGEPIYDPTTGEPRPNRPSWREFFGLSGGGANTGSGRGSGGGSSLDAMSDEELEALERELSAQP